MVDIKVISLGGSIIAPDKVDASFLKRFHRAMVGYLEADLGRRLILVCGGGPLAREYQRAYREAVDAPQPDAQDWIGVAATRLNAELLRHLFLPYCPEPVVTDPTAVTLFAGRILVASGWKPGFSSDYDAVLLAQRFQADTVINLSNIPQVYSADPKVDAAARPLERISWAEQRRLVGDKWVPGKNAPFDPVASELAARLRLRVIVAAGREIDNLLAILAGKQYIGTVIGPD
jgi:uridylate kinase